MELLISPCGTARCVYGEEIDLTQLGSVTIRRGSHVEPTDDGQWMVDLSPVGGPKLGPFAVRSTALAEEVAWLSQNWLVPGQVSIEQHSRHVDSARRLTFQRPLPVGRSFSFPPGSFAMKRRDLESAVAAATGEDVQEIRRRGFSILNLQERDFDPEPDNLLPQSIDWDRLDQQRHRSVFEQVFGPLQPAV